MLDAEGLVSYDITAAASADSGGVSTLSGSFINAPAGDIYLSGFANDSLVGSAVNNEGYVSAETIQNDNGVIVLEGRAGDVISSGGLNAYGYSGSGGSVYVLSDSAVNISGQIDASGSLGGGDIRIGSSSSDLSSPIRSGNQIASATGITLSGATLLAGLDTRSYESVISEVAIGFQLLGSSSGSIALTATSRIDLANTWVKSDLVSLSAPIINNFFIPNSEYSSPNTYIDAAQARVRGVDVSLAETSFYIQPNGASFDDRLNFSFFSTGVGRSLPACGRCACPTALAVRWPRTLSTWPS